MENQNPRFSEWLDKQRERKKDLIKRFQRSVSFNIDGMTNIDEDGNYVLSVGGSESSPSYREGIKGKGAQGVLKFVRRNGYSGWWTLDELEEFLEKGEGPILEKAMKYLNFEFINGEWRGPRVGSLEEIEIIFPNEEIILDESYILRVGKNGLIFCSFNFNPFGSINDFGSGLARKAHISDEQDGFVLEASNVRIDSEAYIYIKAIRPDETFEEFIWPTKISEEKIFDLFDHLAKKMKSEQT